MEQRRFATAGRRCRLCTWTLIREPIDVNLDAKIFVAGHRGLVGSALVRSLRKNGFQNLILRTKSELDLTNQSQTAKFFAAEKPSYVFLAAAKVGGILANNEYPGDFVAQNLQIQTNIIESARKFEGGPPALSRVELYLSEVCSSTDQRRVIANRPP